MVRMRGVDGKKVQTNYNLHLCLGVILQYAVWLTTLWLA